MIAKAVCWDKDPFQVDLSRRYGGTIFEGAVTVDLPGREVSPDIESEATGILKEQSWTPGCSLGKIQIANPSAKTEEK